MNESEKIVAEALEVDGWIVYRNGWPDFLIEKDGEFRFVEVKTPGGPSLSEDQQKMQDALKRAGIDGSNLMVRQQQLWKIERLDVTDDDVRAALRGT